MTEGLGVTARRDGGGGNGNVPAKEEDTHEDHPPPWRAFHGGFHGEAEWARFNHAIDILLGA